MCPSEGDFRAPQAILNLDRAQPKALEVRTDGTAGEPYFKAHTITLKKGEPLDFPISAITTHSTVRWRLEVDTESGNKTETVIAGPEFTTTASQPQSSYAQRWQWIWWAKPEHLEHGPDYEWQPIPDSLRRRP